jgi:Protein of unknown function (DUF2971)
MQNKNKNASPLKLEQINLELGEDEKLKIDIKDNLLPSKLYKYYLINDNSINSFSNESIFIAHPDQLNDTMEGNLKLWDFDNLVIMMKLDGIKDNEFEIKNKFFNEYRDEYFGFRGIFCLTKSYQNNLFWPHYTNENGFCIEFNSEILIKSIESDNLHFESKYVYPISYRNLNKIDLLEYCSFKIENNVKKFDSNIPSVFTVAVKDKLWSYEDEWRIFVKSKVSLKNGLLRKLKYESSSISRIFLAEKFFSGNRFDKENIHSTFIKYTFKKQSIDYKNILIFLEIIFNKFNDKTFIIGRVEQEEIIKKDIEFQISIRKFNIHFVEVEFIEISN